MVFIEQTRKKGKESFHTLDVSYCSAARAVTSFSLMLQNEYRANVCFGTFITVVITNEYNGTSILCSYTKEYTENTSHAQSRSKREICSRRPWELLLYALIIEDSFIIDELGSRHQLPSHIANTFRRNFCLELDIT